jgi:hypothetical protein
LRHPGGEQFLGQSLFDFLKPLLYVQPLFIDVRYERRSDLPVATVNFDSFRYSGLNLSAGTIPQYFCKTFGLIADISTPWLTNIPNLKLPHTYIAVGRSLRYLNTRINYSILKEFGISLIFLGLPVEYESFCTDFPDLEIEFIHPKSALVAASYIQGASAYIGNQSFLFAVAEGLKQRRFLETYEPVPNVVPIGVHCGQFLNTAGLRMLLEDTFGMAVAHIEDNAGGSYQLFRQQ